MINLKKILVPTDFSEFGESALTYGCSIAARFSSELHLLHVCPDAAMLFAEASVLGSVGPADQEDALVQAGDQQLSELLPDDWDNGQPVKRVTRTGSPFYEIIQYAKEEEIDLIVIGTHGRSGLMHLLMGSVAENVVRKSPCPVLTVRPDGHQFVMP